MADLAQENSPQPPSSMRRIIEIGEHSIFVPGLVNGGYVLDVGANRGRFGRDVSARFPVKVWAIEANPVLAAMLRKEDLDVVECALGATDGPVKFHVGINDEASSTRIPSSADVQLVVKQSVRVVMKTLENVLDELQISSLTCVKLDIEGGEVDVIESVGPVARQLCPQWTVEFHDDSQFRLCAANEVDSAIATMVTAGFSVLIRNWPSRTNVLFLDRRALAIGWIDWLGLKFRYQYFALLWRKFVGLR